MQELHHLFGLDAPGVQPEEEPLPGEPGDEGQALPAEGLLEHRRLSFTPPSPHPVGAGAQAAFVDEDNGPAFAAGLFLRAGRGS